MRSVLVAAVVIATAAVVHAQEVSAWKKPPEPIASLITAEPTPDVSLSPDRRFLLFTSHEALPGVDVLSRPHRKLAGLRIDPATHGPQLSVQTRKLVLRSLADGKERELQLPAGHLGTAVWAADGEHIAFTRAAEGGRELWLVNTRDGACKRVPGITLNAVAGAPAQWCPDQQTLLCRLVLPGEEPALPIMPAGPAVQETAGGQKAQVRTNPDMLQNEDDCRRFEWFARTQLALVDVNSGAVQNLGAPDLHTGAEVSPDGNFVLVSTLHRPFSFQVGWHDFPRTVAVWDRLGKVVRKVADLPLHEQVPIGGVPTGPRGIDWLPVAGHVLHWTEALDGGDPKAKVPFRDQVLVLGDLAGEAQKWFQTQHRAAGLGFGSDGRLAMAREFDRDTRRQRVWRFDAGDLAAAGTMLYERSSQDAYGDPGQPVTELTAKGQALMRQRGSTLFLTGQGASVDGDRPFLDAWDLATGQKQRLFQCAAGRFESIVGFLDGEQQRVLLRSESPTEPPNYFAVSLAGGERQALTQFTDPALQFTSKVRKELLHYQREDGVALSGTLYLPPEWQPGQRVPTFVWAYPLEYAQASDAGQVRSSPYRYVRLAGISQLWLLLAGYAVLDDAAMPIVGPVHTANDTFVQQLQWNAKAAVKALQERGVSDSDRIAVGGHSYGAFMTANLLVHTDCFCAGIARSGAYNRTLTPFGFQNEERTYWEAPQIYETMSPFAHIDRCKAPILLIHGEDDDNQGTFPIQSQRLYAAIKGHGGTARLVLLPHEAHGYRARENVLQCIAEMVEWLDRYCKHGRQAVEAGAARAK